MCLAVPGRIVSVEGTCARVDFGGVERDIYLDMMPDAGVGAWVLAHAGFAIQRVSAEEAAQTLQLFEELAAFQRQEDEERLLGDPTEVST